MAGINRRMALKILILRKLRRRMKRKVRECSIRPIFFKRLEQGDTVLMRELREDPHYHHRYFR
jgi:hypothetical protein